MANHIASGFKHPDNMTKKDHMSMISSLPEKEAFSWWMKYALSKVSRKSYEKARGRGL